MKRTLFGYAIIMKSLVDFCDPTTQEAIEAKIKEYGDNIPSVVYYEKFQCPRDVRFWQEPLDFERQYKMEQDFFQNFSQEEIAEIKNGNSELSSSQSTSFEKYSRELDEQDIENLPGFLRADSVRIVDFESIINGFNNDELKHFAETLKSDKEKLKGALTEWIDTHG